MQSVYLYLHPLFDERKCTHRFSWHLHNAFSSNLMHLERFDYRGTGQSSSPFSEITIQSLQNDIKANLKNDTTGIIGIRFGATLAMDYLIRSKTNIDRLILIEPILFGSKYISYLRRKQKIKDLMTGQKHNNSDNGFENIEGFKTSRKLISQIENIDLLNIKPDKKLKTKILLIKLRPACAAEIENAQTTMSNCFEQVNIYRLNLHHFWERIPPIDYKDLIDTIVEFCND